MIFGEVTSLGPVLNYVVAKQRTLYKKTYISTLKFAEKQTLKKESSACEAER